MWESTGCDHLSGNRVPDLARQDRSVLKELNFHSIFTYRLGAKIYCANQFARHCGPFVEERLNTGNNW